MTGVQTCALPISLDPAEAGSADDQRAAQFLANTAAANRRIAGLSAPQRLLDMIGASATKGDGRDQRAVQAIIEQARQDIATRIRAGETITARTVLTRSDSDVTPDQRTEGVAA